MKTILEILILVSAAVSRAQDMAAPIAKELDQIKFMTGKWKAEMTMMMGPQEEKGSSTVEGRLSLGGRYVEADHTYASPSLGKMVGKQMMGYNAEKKSFYAYWFDSMGDGALEMWGNWSGNKLVMTGKPFEMPGMPPMVMRATYTKHSDTKYDFLLEHQQGDKWAPLMKGTYTKS